ncbi:MAG: sodium-dependent transporter [Pseudomonadota bacterium]
MQTSGGKAHENWSSRFTFIMAAVGSAVGLGNFWRFPYEAGTNGGGAFVIVYLVSVVLIAVPIIICELAIGRRAGLSAVASTRKAAVDEGKSPAWQIAAWIGMCASLLVLSFYSVIAGWLVAYVPLIAKGTFSGVTAEVAGSHLTALHANPKLMILTHTGFMALTIFIVLRGLNKGIEVVVNVLMPVFFVLMLLMAVYAMIIGAPGEALAFLLTPDFSKITPAVVISALGQAFFSVSVGTAVMITYGAYLDKSVRIPRSAGMIAAADTLVAMIAGMLIFSIVFGFGLDPDVGPGLVFVTLPVAFGQMPFGTVIGTVFFLLALVAAITSSISMLEIFVAYAEEYEFLPRRRAAILGGGTIWLLGMGSVFSFTESAAWSRFYPLDFIPMFREKNWFAITDTLTDTIMLPLGGLLVAVFSGWVVSKNLFRDEVRLEGAAFSVWHFLVRYVAPVTLVGVLLARLGALDFLL